MVLGIWVGNKPKEKKKRRIYKRVVCGGRWGEEAAIANQRKRQKI